MLVASSPAANEVLARSPGRVVLRFSEPVETAFSSVRVYDASARRVDEGPTERPAASEVAARVRRGLPRGTYTVAWRVVSADSHPVSGALVFHVGRPAAGAAGGAPRALAEQAGSRVADLAAHVVRFLLFALLLACAGGALALALVLRGEHAVRRPLWAALGACALGLAAVSALGLGVQGAKAGGLGLAAGFRGGVLAEVLETQFGRVSLARAALALALALLCALALRAPRAGEPALAACACLLAVALALTPGLAGHARVAGPVALASDWAHVLAGSAWAGGLAFLLAALAWARGARWELAARAVPRFSSLAVVSVAVLAATGLVSGVLEVRSWAGLWETTYGRLLLAKAALVLPVLGLGAFNNRISVPRLRRDASPRARRRFLQVALAELGLVAVILGVTALLAGEPPARAQVAARAGPAAVVPGGPISREAEVGPFHLELAVDPARAGANAIHLYLLERSTGQPASVDEIRIAASLPAAGLGPLRLEVLPAGAGHAAAQASLPLAGEWRLRMDVRRGDFDQWSATVTVPIK